MAACPDGIGAVLTVLTGTARRRVLYRAATAWRDGHPHTAWSILAQAGMGELWPEFQRVALRHARSRYQRAMSKATVR